MKKIILMSLMTLLFTGCYSENTEYDDESDTQEEITQQNEFKGKPCIGDCSGHNAGYEWAEDKGITDPDDCGGNSQSFIEGCQSYAEENSDTDVTNIGGELNE